MRRSAETEPDRLLWFVGVPSILLAAIAMVLAWALIPSDTPRTDVETVEAPCREQVIALPLDRWTGKPFGGAICPDPWHSLEESQEVGVFLCYCRSHW